MEILTASNFCVSVSLVFPNSEGLPTSQTLEHLSRNVIEYSFDMPDEEAEDAEEIDDDEDEDEPVFEHVDADDHKDDSLAGHLFMRVNMSAEVIKEINFLWEACDTQEPLVEIEVSYFDSKGEVIFLHKFTGISQDEDLLAAGSKADLTPLTIDLNFDLYDTILYATGQISGN